MKKLQQQMSRVQPQSVNDLTKAGFTYVCDEDNFVSSSCRRRRRRRAVSCRSVVTAYIGPQTYMKSFESWLFNTDHVMSLEHSSQGLSRLADKIDE